MPKKINSMMKFLFLNNCFIEGRNSSLFMSAELLGGVLGFDLKNMMQLINTAVERQASTSIKFPISSFDLLLVTIIPGRPKPIAIPIGFDTDPIVVAIALVFGLNQNAASLAGAFKRNGCPIPPKMLPTKMLQKLS
mmetsp:Transcript_20358/g.20356  ORF Transcript_20358/g.20356 Transcript_20358/m.20356 type:complete len:136 (+) Transcript_20358:595-1002(+)